MSEVQPGNWTMLLSPTANCPSGLRYQSNRIGSGHDALKASHECEASGDFRGSMNPVLQTVVENCIGSVTNAIDLATSIHGDRRPVDSASE
jgi:hypothetical protein